MSSKLVILIVLIIIGLFFINNEDEKYLDEFIVDYVDYFNVTVNAFNNENKIRLSDSANFIRKYFIGKFIDKKCGRILSQEPTETYNHTYIQDLLSVFGVEKPKGVISGEISDNTNDGRFIIIVRVSPKPNGEILAQAQVSFNRSNFNNTEFLEDPIKTLVSELCEKLKERFNLQERPTNLPELPISPLGGDSETSINANEDNNVIPGDEEPSLPIIPDIPINRGNNGSETLTNFPKINLSEQDAKTIGDKIWMNEGSQKEENLTFWKENENHASIGIGHFIWYPKGVDGTYQETFPNLLIFLEENGWNLPIWLKNNRDCPWNTHQEFLENEHSLEMIKLREFMRDTIPNQVEFMVRRINNALPKILETLPDEHQRQHIKDQFDRVRLVRPNGIYALVDYVNFKGEGISPNERYKNQGWGLLQVLEQMSGYSDNAVNEFADAAMIVLKRRIENSPLNKRQIEESYLKGWENRINTYRE